MKSEKINKNVQAADPIKALTESVATENVWPIETLPSNYNLYPEGTKLFGRPLKVIELKMLSSLNADNLNFVINDVLRRSITGLKIEDLTVADKLYLIFWLRANTYKDSGYTIDFTCPTCRAKGKYKFELDSLAINYLSDNFDETKLIVLPSSNTVKIKQLRISDEIRIANFKKTNASSLHDFDEDLLHVASVIYEINGAKSGIIDAYDFLTSNKISPDDYAYITSYLSHYDFGVDPETPVKCNACGGETSVSVSFRPDFFVPKYKFE